MKIDKNIKFPVKVIWEEESELYYDIGDLEMNVEDFDSKNNPERIYDNEGELLILHMKMMEIIEFRYARDQE